MHIVMLHFFMSWVLSSLLMANQCVAHLQLSQQMETIKTIQTKQDILEITFLKGGSHWAHIDDTEKRREDREVFRYGCQCSESNWTQGANEIYWCSTGPRSPQNKGKRQALKTTNGILITQVWRRKEQKRKKRVIFNHEVPLRAYRMVNTPSGCRPHCVNAAFNRDLAGHVRMATHQIACGGAGVTSP